MDGARGVAFPSLMSLRNHFSERCKVEFGLDATSIKPGPNSTKDASASHRMH